MHLAVVPLVPIPRPSARRDRKPPRAPQAMVASSVATPAFIAGETLWNLFSQF